MENKKVKPSARQENGQDPHENLGKINPCWVTFWTIIFELEAKMDRMEAEKKTAREATGSLKDHPMLKKEG